jgi:archaeoflavoprotein AfpA
MKKKKVAWGITGSGDRLIETFETMRDIQEKYQDKLDIRVYISKAGEQVIKYYKLFNDLENAFDKIWVEINANSPFLAGQLQLGKFEFIIIAPATSNTVAKISLGIADNLLSNAAVMAQKAFVPTYIMPCDYKEGLVVTKLPNGNDLTLRVRKEDAEHVKRVASLDDVFVLEEPKEICQIFDNYFKTEKV